MRSLLLVLLSGCLLVGGPSGTKAAVAEPEKGAVKPIPWRDGEKLHYEIDFAMLTAATGVFSAQRKKKVDHLQLDLKTAGIAETLYPIRSKFWSRTQLSPWRSLEYGEERDENGDFEHEKTTVDYQTGKATRERYTDEKTEVYEVGEKAYLTDLVSMSYGLRSGPWRRGQRRAFSINEGGKLKQAEAICEEIEEMEVAGWPKQRLMRIHVEPKGDYEGKGFLDFYITDDARRLPLLAKLKFAYGTAMIRLVKAEQPGFPTLELARD